MKKFYNKIVKPAYLPLILLLIWEVASRSSGIIINILVWLGIPKYTLPDMSFFLPITEIIPATFRVMITGDIYLYLKQTIFTTSLSFFIAAVMGILIGTWIGLSKRLEEYTIPTIDFFRSIPPIALLPLMILFFGMEYTMKVVFISFGVLWPIIINTISGFKSIDPMWIKVAKNLGHEKKTIIRRVMVPTALPYIFTGLKVSLSLSLILSIVVEMLTGNTGLGHYLNYTKMNFEYANMFAAILIIGILGFILNKLFQLIDKKKLKWYYHSKESIIQLTK